MNCKKVFNSFILLSLFSGFLFCEHTKEDDVTLAKKLHFPKEENASKSMYIRWLWYYGDKFENHKVTESKAKESLDSFFGNEEYMVISNLKYESFSIIKIYIVIKEYPAIWHGATKGIFVDENGNQLLFFDMKRGVYTPEKTILDLTRTGFIGESPLCFVIGNAINYLEILIIDKDRCVTVGYQYWKLKVKSNKISHYYLITDAIKITYNKKNGTMDFSILYDNYYSNDEDRYKERRKDIAVLKQY